MDPWLTRQILTYILRAAATDASVATGPNDQKTIQLCGPFFTSPSTRYFLFQADKGENPGVPFRDNTISGRCDNTKEANYFATVGKPLSLYPDLLDDNLIPLGHTLLHEITHLDAVAEAAGYTADKLGRHRSLDAQRRDQCELLGARAYLGTWANDNTREASSPDYNAESLASSATGM